MTHDDRATGGLSARPERGARWPEIAGWAMYDFANSAYTTVVISVTYSVFYVTSVVGEGGRTMYAGSIAAAAIIAIVLSPLVGAICDYSGRKKAWLAASTAICALGTGALALVGPGEVWLGAALLTISHVGFMLGESFCASFLPEIATRKNMGLVSGIGWGLGYFGGLTSLAVVSFLFLDPEAPAGAAQVGAHQAAMIFIAIFYVIASLPTFLLVRERSKAAPGFENASMLELARRGLAETRDSWALARQNAELFRFFAAFTVYMAGLDIIIKFVGIYTKDELGFSAGSLIVIFLLLQISAAIGALLFGLLERAIGAKRTVLITIAWWIAGSLMIWGLEPLSRALSVSQQTLFYVVSIVAGAGLGSIQSSSRAVVGLLSPPERAAQMFGFWGLFSRLAIVLGMAFGPLSDRFGLRPSILLVASFFALGGLLLLRVRIPRRHED